MPLTAFRSEKVPRWAFYFDGIDDYMLVKHNNTLNLTTLTLATRIYNAINYKWTCVGKQSTQVYYDAYAISFAASYGFLGFKITDQNLNLFVLRAPTQFFTKETFLGMTFDGSTLIGYVNSDLVGSRSANPPQQNTSDFYIGRWWSPTQSLRGYLISVYLYNRALSSSEMLDLYNGKVSENGIIMWLEANPDYIRDIDKDGVMEWIDMSGKNNHAKIYGAVLKDLQSVNRIESAVRTVAVVR